MFESILVGPPYLIVRTSTSQEPFKVTVLVARDFETRRVVAVDTIFSEEPRLEAIEIHFPIKWFSMENPSFGQSTYDRNECADWLPGECRSHIMPIVCESCDHLLDWLKMPQRLYFVTYAPLPEKALGKYLTLRDHLQNRGYAVLIDGGTDQEGRTFWELSL